MAKIYTIRQDDEVRNLFQANRDNLLRFLVCRLKNKHEAEDILQECFIKFQGYKPEECLENPEGLLFKIAYTLSIDAIRKRKSDTARESLWVKENITYLSGEAVADIPHIDRSLDSRRNIKAILSLLMELSPKCRQVFTLHKLEGLSHAEVAKQVGVSKSMVEKYMIMALKKINHLRHEHR